MQETKQAKKEHSSGQYSYQSSHRQAKQQPIQTHLQRISQYFSLLSWVLDKDQIWLNQRYAAWYQDFTVLNTHPTIYKGKKEPVCMFMITCKCVWLSYLWQDIIWSVLAPGFQTKTDQQHSRVTFTKIHMEWISYWTTLTFITTKISEWARHTWTRLAFVN